MTSQEERTSFRNISFFGLEGDFRWKNQRGLLKNKDLKDHVKMMDYLFQNCTPEFSGGKISEWLEGKENITESIRKSVDIIRHHPLAPFYVKVQGFMLNNEKEEFTSLNA